MVEFSLVINILLERSIKIYISLYSAYNFSRIFLSLVESHFFEIEEILEYAYCKLLALRIIMQLLNDKLTITQNIKIYHLE